MKNALVFSQTGARNFFTYIIIYEIMGHSHWRNQFSTVPFYILLTTTNPPPFPPKILRSAPPFPHPLLQIPEVSWKGEFLRQKIILETN